MIDITSPQIDQYLKTTLNVLKELGADEKRIITVYNKIDLLDSEERDDIKFNTGPVPGMHTAKSTPKFNSSFARNSVLFSIDISRPIQLDQIIFI